MRYATRYIVSQVMSHVIAASKADVYSFTLLPHSSVWGSTPGDVDGQAQYCLQALFSNIDDDGDRGEAYYA